ncbi:transcriptional repressor [Candidatus Nomurabacteria bacterium]|nr:transcriptional repressor [Candidatus Nomurabacteria bacterium]
MKEDLLKQAGLSKTQARQLILDFLEKNQNLVSAGDIYSALSAHLDRVTVYRNLEILEKAGLVFRELSEKEALYYLADKQHHHITCQKCGFTQCLPCDHFFKKIKNFSQVKHQLFLSGLCNKCNK